MTINDEDENEWLDGMIDSYSTSRWWMGYNDLTVEDYWDWDGAYTEFEMWANGEPDGGIDENCGLMNQFSNEQWSDASCSSVFE